MPNIHLHYEGQALSLRPGQSVLEALEAAGREVCSGCRSGVCQSCLLIHEGGELPPSAQRGLSDNQRALGQFLACQCRPQPGQHLRVRRADSICRHSARVIARSWLAEDILQLSLQVELDYFPGQYLTLWRDDHCARSYSIANLPNADGRIDLHIRHRRNGAFSHWACELLRPGDRLQVQGPMGTCFYAADSRQPLLLAAMGTGLAPIKAILEDALAHGHRGPIYLYAAARQAAQCYAVETLQALQGAHPGLQAVHLALEGERAGVVQGDVYERIAADLADMRGYKVYLCGPASFVKTLRRQCFLAGAAMSDIQADSFIAFGSAAASGQRVA